MEIDAARLGDKEALFCGRRERGYWRIENGRLATTALPMSLSSGGILRGGGAGPCPSTSPLSLHYAIVKYAKGGYVPYDGTVTVAVFNRAQRSSMASAIAIVFR